LSFQKILVPYDGSRFADKALENAIGIAKLSGAETQIILLHVTPHIPIPLTFERPVYSAKTGKSIPLTQYIQELSEEMEAISKVKALGSVSRNVSERASCPVLIVH
jgi:nucleotide-binding universal stress UspA family protein